MSYTLIIEREGFICSKRWEYNRISNRGSYIIKEIQNINILSELGYHVEKLAKGFTLRDYFKMIERYPDLQRLDGYFSDYLEEYHNAPESGCKSKDMPALILERGITVELKDEKVDDFENYFNFHGKNIRKEPYWAIEYCPLAHLLDTPLKIGKTWLSVGKWNESKIYEGEDFPKLYDFVHEIIWELSWAGSPKQRDERMDYFNKTIEEIKSERLV